MPLSLKKLQTILNDYGFVDHHYFVTPETNQILFIELISVKYAENMILQIPQNIFIEYTGNRTAFYINNDFEESCSESEEELDVYEEIEVSADTDDIENTMKNRYTKPIRICDENDKQKLQVCQEQLSRLNLCVQKSVYVICQMFGHYIVYPDNIYCINGYPSTKIVRILPSISLNNFVDNLSSVSNNIRTISESIQSMITKNIPQNIQTLQNIIRTQNSIPAYYSNILSKESVYKYRITQLEELRERLRGKIKEEENKLKQIKQTEQTNYASVQSLHEDIEKINHISGIRDKITEMTIVEDELNSEILDNKNKMRHNILNLDNVCYQNSVLCNKLNENSKLLSNLM